MRIQEVENRVGITRKNIRYYEQEGLIEPSRNRENGYREYSEVDVLLLKRIRLFRRLGVPIEELRRLIRGSLTVSDTMERHKVALDRERENLALSRAMCDELLDAETAFSSLDPEPYLVKMDQLEEKGATFVDHRNQDVRRKMVPSLVAALVMIGLMAFVIGLLIRAYMVEPIPVGIMIFVVLFPAAVCVGVLLALRSRIRELKKGEAEEARKY